VVLGVKGVVVFVAEVFSFRFSWLEVEVDLDESFFSLVDDISNLTSTSGLVGGGSVSGR
jgi:hypothetical protein